jgi:hypothetical protein
MFGFTKKLFSTHKKPRRQATYKPQIEVLEKRELMSVVPLPVVGTTGILASAGAFLPPQPTADGLALINSLPDTPVRSTALADYQRDGMITRNDMIDIFTNVSLNLTADEISSLGTLVYNGPTTLTMPDYVQNLAWKCFNGIGVGGVAGAQILGQNLENFFLGELHPDASIYSYGICTGSGCTPPPPELLYTGTYQPVNLPLWNDSPSYRDVAGEYVLDDGWLLSSLEEMAYRNPGNIQRMFIDNGDGTYTVRLYNGGTPDYVTVDNYLPYGPPTHWGMLAIGAQAQTCLWPALVEKAYVQENAALSTSPGGSYQQEVDAGYGLNPSTALSAIEDPSSSFSFSQPRTSTNVSVLAIAQAWSQGDFVVLHSDSAGYPLYTEYYALLGVDYTGGWFTVMSPAGALWEVHDSDLAANFNSWVDATPNYPRMAAADVSASPAAASTFALSFFPPSTAGQPISVRITAYDAYGNVATGYSGTVHFSSSDPQAVLPADTTLSNGTGSFDIALRTAGDVTLTATDVSDHSITASADVSVSPAAASNFVLSAPASSTAGQPVSVTVTAHDSFGNVANGYSGTIHFTSSDAKAILPANATLNNGTATFSVTFKTLGVKSLTATDTVNPALTAIPSSIQVTGAASGFLLSSFPATTAAGATQTITLTVKDAFGTIVKAYRGTVHFTSSDPQAVLPANYTFTAADAGVHTFSITLKTAGSRSITVVDTAKATLTRTQWGIRVTPAAASQLVITGPTSVINGIAQDFTVRVTDAYGNTVTGYRGTLHFTSSDPQAVLPADYTFTATDAGKHTFRVTFKTPGTQWLQVVDLANGALTVQDLDIVVAY